MRRIHLLLLLLLLALLGMIFRAQMRALLAPAFAALQRRYTIDDRISQYGAGARKRLTPYFARNVGSPIRRPRLRCLA